ncbi:unnamed protein product, partial [Staurois parvus]
HSAHRLHKEKKNIAYTPNKDQRRTGASLDFEWLHASSCCRIAFTSSGRKCPPPPTFHSLLGQSCAIGETWECSRCFCQLIIELIGDRNG